MGEKLKKKSEKKEKTKQKSSDKPEKKNKKKESKEEKPSKKEKTKQSTSSSTREVIFFPDEKLPCNNGSSCTRKSCNFSHEPTGLSRMLDVLRTAKKTLDICVFTITANEIADVILDIHDKGVTVRIITDDEQRKSQGSDIG